MMEDFVICMMVFVAGLLIGAGYKEDQIEERMEIYIDGADACPQYTFTGMTRSRRNPESGIGNVDGNL